MKKTRKRMIAICAMLLLCICILPFHTFAVSEYTVTVSDGEPGMDILQVGDEFEVTVTVSGADFNGMQATIAYDPSVIRLKSVTGIADHAEKAGKVDLLVLDDYGWRSGKVVATLRFKAVSGGISDIEVTYATAGDYDDFQNQDAKPAKAVNDRVKVKSSGITVSFRLIGDWKHDGGVAEHEEYVTWIATEDHEVMLGDTVYDVFAKAISDHGLRQRGGADGYVSAIRAPEVLGGYWLEEFDNGPNSGWMYTVNGEHVSDTLTDRVLEDGDEIVWHYTDDYTLEEKPSSQYYQRWLEADDISPETYVKRNLDKIVTVEGEGEVKPELKMSHIGKDVKFTFTPAEGWNIKNAYVDGKDMGAIETYTYKDLSMTSRIEVVFAQLTLFQMDFIDVSEQDWFYEDVYFVASSGLFNGTGETTFSPHVPMTRAMLVTVLHRLEGLPAVDGSSVFLDVVPNQWYTDAIVWATQNGVVKGYDNGLFGVDDAVTREQMAAILYRYAQHKGHDTTARADLNGYTDAAKISAYAQDAMSWANAEGLINGRTPTTLVPGETATRAEVAAIFHRFAGNIAKQG